jgi:peptidoglycan/xylan/chitin deacetylase (PgdA/CDA1 family)
MRENGIVGKASQRARYTPLHSRGGRALTARAGSIVLRFGLTEAPMERRLRRFMALLDRLDARPTFPITACVLARHPVLIRNLMERGAEFAVHGLVHNDHAELSLEQQRASIATAIAIFDSAGIPFTGFRGPYLRFNQATNHAIADLGFRYHSSQGVVFPVVPPEVNADQRGMLYQRSLDLCEAEDARCVAVRPRLRDGLVHLPVALPSDDALVERLQFDSSARTATWLSILQMTYKRGDLFTIQLHPERIVELEEALEATLAEARRQHPRVWIARLDEIASWWLARQTASLQVEELDAGRYRIALNGPPGTSLLVRGLPSAPARAWYGQDLLAEAPCFEVAAATKPVVGVSARTPAAVRGLLSEEGFPIEISDQHHKFGAYLDVASETIDETAVLSEIERSSGPLVRLWRWPAGARSSLAVTGDVDSITLQDFALRFWERRACR